MLERLAIKKQQGIGLLELMLSLAIIAILLIMATRYYQSARTSQQVNDGLSLTTAIVAASESWVLGQSNFSNLSISELKKQGLIPKEIADDGSNATPWHTRLEVGPEQSDPGKVKIAFDNIPSSACLNMQTKLQSQMDTTKSACGTPPSGKGTFVAVM